MTPGYLHFNLRRGCTSEMICAAMAKFLGGHDPLDSILKSLGMFDIKCEVSETISHNIKGNKLTFYVGESPIVPSHQAGASNFSPELINTTKNAFVRACLSGEAISLSSLRKIFLDKKINPGLSALATKILDNLASSSHAEHKLAGHDALWLFCHLLLMCLQVEALDPKFISASKPFVGAHNYFQAGLSGLITVQDPLVINNILTGFPVVESEENIPVDALALAFIKSLAGHVGVRGESTIMATALGWWAQADNINQNLVEALWCEAILPDSISELGPSAKPRVSFLYEVCGLVSTSFDMKSLSRLLFMQGARSLHYNLVYSEKNIGHNFLRFLVSEEHKHHAVETFLIKGEADDICIRAVEQHELKRRMVNVPMGSGNKTHSYRLYEYIYLGKILRVEPVPEDLSDYILKTDYSVDVARSDMLLAWKKWRKRVAE